MTVLPASTGSPTQIDQKTELSAKVDLTTVQLFDLVEAIDQFFADTQTLPELSLQLTPISKRYVKSAEPLAKRSLPAVVGVSSLALAAMAFFLVPVPEVQRQRDPVPQPNPAGQNQGTPNPGGSGSPNPNPTPPAGGLLPGTQTPNAESISPTPPPRHSRTLHLAPHRSRALRRKARPVLLLKVWQAPRWQPCQLPIQGKLSC